MTCYKGVYGADADGNRGQTIIVAELDANDVESVREQVIAQFDPDVEDYVVLLVSPEYGTEHEFDVSIYEYFTNEEVYHMREE